MLQAALSLHHHFQEALPACFVESPAVLSLHGHPFLSFPGHPKMITQGQILCMGPAFKKFIELRDKL